MSVRSAVPISLPKFTIERVLLAGILLYLLAGRALPALNALAEGDDAGGGSTIQSSIISYPMSSEFTFQGRLEVDGVPASGLYDFEFVLWNAESGGAQVTAASYAAGVMVTNGTFAAKIDFGMPAFDGSDRWLETRAHPSAGGAFLSLGRTALTPVPYAFHADSVPWVGISELPAGFNDGTDNTTELPFDGSTAETTSAFSVTNTGTGTESFGITGIGGTAARGGVFGSSGTNGVVGESSNSASAGVLGTNSASSSGYGVRGDAGLFGTGVFGSAADGGYGVYGSTIGSGAGVYGYNLGGGRGVYGYGNTGVVGRSRTTIFGESYGVVGDEAAVGVRGVGAVNGVEGSSGNAAGSGVYGVNSGNGFGVYGRSVGGDGTTGEALTVGKSGIVGKASGGAHQDFAGYFVGNVNVVGGLEIAGDSHTQGTLTAQVKTFKIDHPLDPAGKWLYHTALESPDMKNLYDGVVTTGADGLATVQLPDYFEALNRDFRYQLTIVGGDTWARARIASEVSGNVFVIETDQPNVTVSWQVTGIRHDAFADAHRTEAEVAKTGDDLGTCIEPTACAAP